MMQILKEWIKKAFNAFGFEIRRKGQGTKRITLADALDHFVRLGFEPQTVIDVGVADGTFELYEKFPGAKHLLIEPLKEWEVALKKISGKYNAEYVLAAAGSKPGTTTINVHTDLSGSSILRETEGSHVDGTPRKVPVITIDDVCKEKAVRGPYVIKVDVQGAELLALDGAQKTLEDTELVLLEVSMFKFFENGPEFYDVINYMKSRGFVVYDIFDTHNRPLDDALAQVNIAFVRENGQFRKCHYYATLKQREEFSKHLK